MFFNILQPCRILENIQEMGIVSTKRVNLSKEGRAILLVQQFQRQNKIDIDHLYLMILSFGFAEIFQKLHS